MGCGHSKINIYSKRTRNKNTSKKTVTPEKTENEDEDPTDGEVDGVKTEGEGGNEGEKIDDCDRKATIKVKPFGGGGGPLLAHTELSSSQNNFFRMLDEKIENGPDYDSGSETERALEKARLNTLMKDWETASAGSRSLPATPKRRPPRDKGRPQDGVRTMEMPPRIDPQQRTIYNAHTQSLVHQSYGITPYRPTYHVNPVYANSPPHQSHPSAQYSSALQYQGASPLYTSQPTYQQPLRQFNAYSQQQPVNQQGSPLKTYSNNSPKHIPYEPPSYSPNHKTYTPIPKSRLSNGDLIQQQMYQQYQQARDYQHYKTTREQQHIIQHQGYPPPGVRNYQSSVHIPIVMPNPQTELSHREQYELT